MNKNVKFKGGAVTLVGDSVKVGEKAKDFVVVGNDMNPVKLSDFAGKTVIISIFPSIDTPVCATQNRKFNEEAVKLGDDLVILGVSMDLPFALGRFCGAEGIDKVITTSDYLKHEFSEHYGFFIKELGLLARGTVVVGKDGLIKFVEYVPEITNEPDYESVLKIIKALEA